MIPKETVDRVLDIAQIEEVVEEFVELKKRGSNLIGLCPFHEEKTPSFSLSPVKQIYKCFGCGRSGNVAKFLMEHENYTYPEALRQLAKMYGIEIQEKELSEEERKARTEQDSLFIVLNYAKDFYHHYLFNVEEGKTIGLSYLKERGYHEATIQKFELGYSPNANTALVDDAQSHEYQPEYLEKAGLAFQSKDSSLMDQFRDRVMFPIHSASGRVLGFGGRIMKSNAKAPKYINTPETEVYDKSRILYGLYQAKDAIRKKEEMILVEGYTDVISLHQEGIENVVATSGTSLTENHVKLIRRYTAHITFLFDGDEAGITASKRGINLALEGGLNVKVVTLPEGEDPDSFALNQGGDAMRTYLTEHANDFIMFQTQLLKEEAKKDPTKKTQNIKEIIDSVSRIPDNLNRSIYIKECSRNLDVSEEVLYQELNKLLMDRQKKAQKRKQQDEQPPEADEITDNKESQKDFFSGSSETQERDVIKLLLLYGKEWLDEEITVGQHILAETEDLDWENPVYTQIRQEYVEYMGEHEAPPDVQHFIRHQAPEIQSVASDLAAESYQLSDNWSDKIGYEVVTADDNYRRIVKVALSHLKLKKVHKLLQENNEELKKAESDEKVDELLQVHMYLSELKQKLSYEVGATIVN